MDAAGLDRLISLTAGTIARGWLAAIAHIREANPVADLAARLASPQRHAHTLVVDLPAAIASFAAAEHNAFSAAAQAESRYAAAELQPAPIAKKLLTFDAADPGVLSWAERNKLDLVRDLTFEQRSLVRAMLIRIDEEGTNPLEAARDILDAIGLTPTQEAAVQSYRRALRAGQYGEALQRELSSGVSDRVIAAAQRASAALTDTQIETAVARYRANYIRLRAETIARTEGLRIAHQGSDALYRQAVARGDIDSDQLVCEWLHSPRAQSKHEREFHKAMHGQQRAWGVPFVSGLGNELRFPCDPNAPAEETINCRCARTVRIQPVAIRANAA